MGVNRLDGQLGRQLFTVVRRRNDGDDSVSLRTLKLLSFLRSLLLCFESTDAVVLVFTDSQAEVTTSLVWKLP